MMYVSKELCWNYYFQIAKVGFNFWFSFNLYLTTFSSFSIYLTIIFSVLWFLLMWLGFFCQFFLGPVLLSLIYNFIAATRNSFELGIFKNYLLFVASHLSQIFAKVIFYKCMPFQYPYVSWILIYASIYCQLSIF